MTADRKVRTHDVVVFGATGFAGALTAEYLARHAPSGCRWALAGRNRGKLEELRARLSAINPDSAELPLLHADVTDPATLEQVAANARVVITTVGPYTHYGEPLVAACARNGTDYVDLTGEPEFVDRVYLAHHETARKSGARIVHSCGFDSLPYDLGVYYTVKQLPEGVPLTVEGQFTTQASISGGTFATTLTILSRAREAAAVAKQRRAVEPRPEGRSVRTPLGRVRRDKETRRWLVPMPTLDPQIVARSATALPRYGPDFTYRHNVAMKHLVSVAALGLGFGLLAVLAQIPPARNALGRLYKPGKGPSEERRAKSWFNVRFTGEGGGKRVVTEFAGGDPGYDETAKMLAESALCLAFDDLPTTSGQLTTATAMGDALLVRLTKAGLTIRTLSES